MSNNGFLKLDNSIIDYWMSKLSHSEFKTLLVIYRKTVGWGKQYDKISQNQISELTGITTRSVRTAINSLENLKLIITTGKNKSVKMFTLNTETLFNVCLKSDEVLEMENKLEIISNEQVYQCKSDDTISYDNDENFLHKRHSKDTNKKQVKEMVCTNEINITFIDFWDKYDYNKGMKSSVEAKWESLSDEERTLTMQSLDRYIQSTPDKTYRKFPMTYLNTESWNEEVIIPTDNNNVIGKDSTTTSSSNHSYSASFKPFESNVGNRTRDDLECNLEALGIATEGVITNTPSQIHWSELKTKGLLKTKVNPTAIAPNTDTDKMINEFLARNSSNRFKDNICA